MSSDISDLHMNYFLTTVQYQIFFFFLYFQKYEIQPSRSLFCSAVLYLRNETKWSLAKTSAQPS